MTPAQEVVNQTKANFLFVEGGSFMMGIEGFREDTKPYQVTLSSYAISKYETTFKEYDVYHNIIGKEIVGKDMRGVIKDYGENYGVKRVTWQEARNYCQWLGKQLNLPIDLPTEAQWEYAARSRGKIVEHATNNGKIEGSYTEKRNYNGSKVRVGVFPPNPLGLYDMSGGRPEWVLDWYAWYSKEPKTNPIQDTIQYSDSKVVRGLHKLRYSVYTRVKRKPDNNGTGIGFRCVCNQETPVQ